MLGKLLFDTNVLIDHLRGYSRATDFLQEKNAKNHFLLSAITVAELYRGIQNEEEKAAIETLISYFQIISVDHEISIQGGEICHAYRKSHGTDLMDALIAATADHHNATLVTLNTKHFPMIKTIKPY